MRQKLIIYPVAISQFLQSVVCAGAALHGSVLLLIFGFWGLINSMVLLSSNILARQSALLWHAIAVGYVLIWCLSPTSEVQNNKSTLLLAAMNVGAILCLAKALGYLGSRNAT